MVLLPLAFLIPPLAFGIWLGLRRWVEPRGGLLRRPARLFMALLVGVLVSALLGGVYSWAGGAGLFYRPSPFGGRMLGAAAWGLAVPAFEALEHPTTRRLRLALAIPFVFLGLTTIAVTLAPRARFLASPSAVAGLLACLIAVLIVLGAFLLRQPLVLPNGVADYRASGALERAWISIAGLLLGLWGALLYAVPDGPAAWLWMWRDDPLTNRLLGSALLALGGGAVFSARLSVPARILLGALVTFGLGTALAGAWSALTGEPAAPAYLIVFGAVALISAALRLSSGSSPHIRRGAS